MANKMRLTMDDDKETNVEFCDGVGLCIEDSDGQSISVDPDRVEEFMTLCRKVIDYFKNQPQPAE
jgi:hypothetical protein